METVNLQLTQHQLKNLLRALNDVKFHPDVPYDSVYMNTVEALIKKAEELKD